ncbi:MAG TPA: C4-dicarboxylate transporter DcuC [Candidatus Olsenella pullicola]|nr:C4-dicarboxylate transporter DcuC [Candidatus Olsenella pullicola]
MDPILMYAIVVVAFAVVIFMLIKKMDIKITLFLMGIVLMYVAMATGGSIAIDDFAGTGLPVLDPLMAIVTNFKSTIASSGFIILILGGYSAYMSAIGANDATVYALTRPIRKIKSPYVLVPVVFLLGNVLSLVVPSASNLAIILLATLYPVLRKAGMSPLTAGAIIATTATIMPTPLGSDNVAIAEELAKYPEYAGLTVTEYVLQYHAMVSIPTLLIMAVVHFFWQRFCDSRDAAHGDVEKAEEKDLVIEGSALHKVIYAILPLLPIFLLIAVYLMQVLGGSTFSLSVEVATLFSLVVAILCDIVHRRSGKEALEKSESFFKGMGGAMPVVGLLVAAQVFVVGLNSIGLIDSLETAMVSINGTGMGFVLPLILVGLTALIVLLSGSGTALFFALVPLIPALATAAGISAVSISVPMGLAGNLFRAVSPVSAVVMIVSGTIEKSPIQIVRRTAIPMISGVVIMFVLSVVMFL